ncbi:protein JTB [Bombina bombina]|uniref:protein JTB n=1 Tax=Bombina bombina TaxID=8345 RepID=UPI00235B203F|nr:protein JTB [Bombina bombina]
MCIAEVSEHSLYYTVIGIIWYCTVMRLEAWVLGALLALLMERPAESSLQEKTIPDHHHALTTPCWAAEEYLMLKECYACPNFQYKTTTECSVTGFVEQVKCATSNKEEYKSCRSVVREKEIFWEFVGSMIIASVVVSLIVIFRQRTLDRRALEKVRKQIESI